MVDTMFRNCWEATRTERAGKDTPHLTLELLSLKSSTQYTKLMLNVWSMSSQTYFLCTSKMSAVENQFF